MTNVSISNAVVVGAGPTGLATAIGLAQQGVDVRVLDGAGEGANSSRAAVVHARTLEVLESVGVTEALLARAVTVPWFDVRDGDRRLARIGLGRLPTRYPYTAMIAQADTEAILRARLHELGVDVEWNCEVADVVTTPGGAQVAFRRPNGRVLDVEADLVVGADGMHSRVRSAIGVEFVGRPYAQSFVLADVRMTWPVPRDTVSLTFGARGLVVVAPLPDDRFRIVATANDPAPHPNLGQIQALLLDRAGAADVHEIVESGRFRVHHRLAATYWKDRVVLAGDSAHVHSPAGGQGMNTGIQDGLALADIVGRGGELGEYERVRRPVAERVVRLTDRATRAATAKNPAARSARNLMVRTGGALPPVRDRLAMQLSELTYR